MVTKEINVLMNLKGNLIKELKKSTKEINRLSKAPTPLQKWKGEQRRINKELATTEKHIATLKSQKGVFGWVTKGKQGMAGFNGAALSTMFLGMQLQKTFGKAFSSIFEGYKKIIPENSKFNKEMTKLNANWEFFKFQLADTMVNSGVFDVLVGGAIWVIQTFEKMSKTTKLAIGVMIGTLALLGTYLMATSVIRLGMAGLLDQYKFLGKMATNFSWGSLAKTGWIALAVLAIAGLYKAWDTFSDSSDYARNKTEAMKSTFSDTLNSVIKPLGEAFGSMGFEVENGTEALVVIGAVMQDLMLLGGGVLDLIIALVRTFVNLVQIGLNPVIEAFKTMSDIWASITIGDWSGAWDAAMDYKSNLDDAMMTDVADIGDAWKTMYDNIDKKREAIVSPAKALDEYRAEITGKEDTQSKTDIFFVTPEEAYTQMPSEGQESYDYLTKGY